MKKHASDCCQAVMKALQRRVWEKTKTQSSALTPTSSAARGVGLILYRPKRKLYRFNFRWYPENKRAKKDKGR